MQPEVGFRVQGLEFTEEAHVCDIADRLVEAGVDVVEGEEVDRHARFSGTNHHITTIRPLAGGEHAAVIVDVVSHARPADHGVWVALLQTTCQLSKLMRCIPGLHLC